MVARKEADGSKFFYHPDHLGSTTLVTDQYGNKNEETNYKPFGEPLYDAKSRFLFTGKELDSESGLYYYGARYYDAWKGQFTQPDSMIPNPYDPQMLNRYSYVRNNPYLLKDDSGNSPTIVTAAIGAGAGFAIGGLFSLGTQLWNNGGNINQVSWSDVGKSAVVGGVAGGVAGLTMGASMLVMGASEGVGIGLSGTILAGSAAGVTSGRAAQISSNVMEGQDIGTNLLNPESIATDAVLGGIGSGVSFKATEFLSNKLGKPVFTEKSISHIEKYHVAESIGSKSKFISGLDYKKLGKEVMANGRMSIQLRQDSYNTPVRLAFSYNSGTVIGTRGGQQLTSSRLIVSPWYHNVINMFSTKK